jgi:hypothetical protein
MKHIAMICSLAECTEDRAREEYTRTKDVLLAVDSILFQTELPNPLKRKREDITPEEEYLAEVRKTMKAFDTEMDNRPIANQPDCVELSEMQTLPEETVQQNSCLQICQIPSMEGVDQIQETACQTHPECSCDSQ